MPGPTTEILNDDIKELKADLREVRSSAEILKADVHGTAISLAEMRAEFRFAKWLIGLTLVATLSGIGAGIWWAATVTADIKYLEASSSEKFKAIDGRIDRLEASIAKVLEQTRPKP